jgi:hypothetical protein
MYSVFRRRLDEERHVEVDLESRPMRIAHRYGRSARQLRRAISDRDLRRGLKQKESGQYFSGLPKMTFASSSPLSPGMQTSLCAGWRMRREQRVSPIPLGLRRDRSVVLRTTCPGTVVDAFWQATRLARERPLVWQKMRSEFLFGLGFRLASLELGTSTRISHSCRPDQCGTGQASVIRSGCAMLPSRASDDLAIKPTANGTRSYASLRGGALGLGPASSAAA